MTATITSPMVDAAISGNFGIDEFTIDVAISEFVAFDLKDPVGITAITLPPPVPSQPMVVQTLSPQVTPSTTDHEGVRAQLNRLETLGSPSAIADFFRRENVKGTLGSGSLCPIARWLTASCGPVSVGYRVLDPNSAVHIATLPGAALVFAQNFDRQLYPDLIAS